MPSIMGSKMNDPFQTATSKYLSYVLRHAPDAIGLTLDSEGWASLADLIEGAGKNGHPLDEALIRTVVENNDKQRFAISEDGLSIRAVQGHSAGVSAISRVEKRPPETLLHGTATRFVDSIRRDGLLPGKRQHVHLTENEQIALTVGQRYGKPALLRIEAQRMYQHGFKFFQADNGVWLTEKVPADFITLVR